MQRNILIPLVLLATVSVLVFFLNQKAPEKTIQLDSNALVDESPITNGPEIQIPTTEVSSSSNETVNMSSSTAAQPSGPQVISDNAPESEVVTPVSGLVTMAWIYPSEPGCNAQREYRDGRVIDILKPEFFTINGGALTLLDATNSSCNGYSKNFIADLKRYSAQQYVTVSSASAADMNTFLTSANLTADINTLVTFVVDNNLTGIELDFEDFGGWNEQTYQKYLAFVKSLGEELHANGKKLMLDGPAIANSIEQNWFSWKYEDFTSLPVDHIVLMAYDYQFDHGTGQPVAPLEWIKEVTSWAAARYPKQRLSVGIPSYGYEGTVGKRPYIRTYDQLKNKPGFSSATRNIDSGEMTWKSGDTVYFYQDEESIRQKIKIVTDLGINSISVWHLGGNLWFK